MNGEFVADPGSEKGSSHLQIQDRLAAELKLVGRWKTSDHPLCVSQQCCGGQVVYQTYVVLGHYVDQANFVDL